MAEKNELKADWMMIKVIEQSRTSFPGQKVKSFSLLYCGGQMEEKPISLDGGSEFNQDKAR